MMLGNPFGQDVLYEEIPQELPDPVASRLSLRLRELFKSLEPKETDIKIREAFLQRLKAILKDEWPHLVIDIHVFGSYVTGLSSKHSDIDVCLTTDKIEPDGPQNMYVLTEALQRRGIKHIDLTRIKARVPVIRLYDEESNVSCDIIVNHTAALGNTALIRNYVSLNEDIAPLFVGIKQWTKKRALNDAFGGGTLSTYCWCIMMLHYCMRMGILPVGQVENLNDGSIRPPQQTVAQVPPSPATTEDHIDPEPVSKNKPETKQLPSPVTDSGDDGEKETLTDVRDDVTSSTSPQECSSITEGSQTTSATPPTTPSSLLLAPQSNDLSNGQIEENGVTPEPPSNPRLGQAFYRFFRYFALEYDYEQHVVAARSCRSRNSQLVTPTGTATTPSCSSQATTPTEETTYSPLTTRAGLPLFPGHTMAWRDDLLLTKEEKGWHLFTPYRRGYNVLCVEDPCNMSRNLSNNASSTTVRGIQSEFWRVTEALYSCRYPCDVDTCWGTIFEEYIFPPITEWVPKEPIVIPLSERWGERWKGERMSVPSSPTLRAYGSRSSSLPPLGRKGGGPNSHNNRKREGKEKKWRNSVSGGASGSGWRRAIPGYSQNATANGTLSNLNHVPSSQSSVHHHASNPSQMHNHANNHHNSHTHNPHNTHSVPNPHNSAHPTNGFTHSWNYRKSFRPQGQNGVMQAPYNLNVNLQGQRDEANSPLSPPIMQPDGSAMFNRMATSTTGNRHSHTNHISNGHGHSHANGWWVPTWKRGDDTRSLPDLDGPEDRRKQGNGNARANGNHHIPSAGHLQVAAANAKSQSMGYQSYASASMNGTSNGNAHSNGHSIPRNGNAKDARHGPQSRGSIYSVQGSAPKAPATSSNAMELNSSMGGNDEDLIKRPSSKKGRRHKSVLVWSSHGKQQPRKGES